ncbi:hypothetical protein DFQ11_103191 [Winogradskyella epiphytica]|uniref:Tetratricopeptide repeat protein n=1 Tax=Winogradskyella epiphytica TaxID=262005 RepID=A0A2V4XSQ0_9FLAO|nr:tetratricopeptide repeat protein [Winogradskyella epiphytica]PYE81111.1 hypothetical protein DFQ11_103191 [Winogradskyella epiphytica]GGW66935.1 hypothetical protein GCM10008085_18530 [Winogradskyella epiphytica]
MTNLSTVFRLSCFVLIFICSSCKQKASSPNAALASIDLKREELLLCSTEQFGDVSFALDCNYEVREVFDLALSLLHSFEYAEAEKTFVKVIDADPECAMAYWGVAMSIYHSLWAPPNADDLRKGSKLIDIAQSLDKSEKAKQYIEAIGAYYKDWEQVDHQTREVRYANKMEDIYLSDKDDAEATVFYALALTSSAAPNDKTFYNQRKAGALLEKLFEERPNHPGIAHYIIHSYDYPELASLGLNSARRYAEIAPGSAHAQHMPSHIFTRLGLWQESIDTNINSASSAQCYAQSVNPNATWTQEIHAVDYLVYAYLQLGDNEKALEYIKEMRGVDTVFPANDLASAYALTAIPIRMALENKNWEDAANLELPKTEFDWEKSPWQEALLHFGKALGYAHLGKISAAENELKTLKELHQQLENRDSYKATQVKIQIHAADAWIQLAKGHNSEALSLMELAAKMEAKTSKHPVTPGEVLPADELLGDLLLKLNKPTEALKVYEVNLESRPNRFNGLYGAAVAAKQSGNNDKATLYFNKLLELTKSSNGERPEITEANQFISKHQII